MDSDIKPTLESPSPAILLAENSPKPVNDGVPHHKLACPCKVCKRIREAKASGKPNRAELRLRAEANRKARAESKIAIKASLKTQIALGRAPDVTLAAKLAGKENGRVEPEARSSFVQTALSRAGITDDSLATLAREGMEAFNQKIITDQDGAIVDVVNMPDWRNRHAFWRDILMVKKLLGSDAESLAGGSGGLVIITPDAAKVSTGHPPACICEDCRVAWETKAKHLRVATMRETAIDAQIEPEIPQDVVVETETDDRGALTD
jgi:hypothetical protein